MCLKKEENYMKHLLKQVCTCIIMYVRSMYVDYVHMYVCMYMLCH